MKFMILSFIFGWCLPVQAQEKICIDGSNFRQIKCEKIVYYDTIPSKPNPELLAKIEKMYPRPPEIVQIHSKTKEAK